MIKPRKFEAFDLELLCKYIAGGETLGKEYYDYMLDAILGNELCNCSQGMSYSLIDVDLLYNALSERLEKYKSQPFEVDLLKFFETLKNGDETLIYVKGW